MSLKTIVVAFVCAIVFFVAIVAAVVAAAQLSATAGPDADLRFSGILSHGNVVNYSPAHRSARQFANFAGVPQISDDTIQHLMKAVIAKAEQGDTECSMLVLELAAAQRSAPTTRPAGQ